MIGPLPRGARTSVLALLLLAEAAQPLHVGATTTRSLHHPAVRRASLACCAAEGEADAVAADGEPAPAPAAADPKAAEKEEKKALREAIAALESRLPVLRGDLASATESAKDAGENGYLLLAANFERFRQQARSEVDSQKGYGRASTLRLLLPFAERFEVLQAAADDDAEDASIHKFYGGIYKQTQQLLEAWKAEPFEAVVGEAYDFKRHTVAERLPSDDAPANQILSALTCGWTLDGEVVRPAKCTVSSGPAAVEEASSAEEGSEGAPAAAEGADAADAADGSGADGADGADGAAPADAAGAQ